MPTQSSLNRQYLTIYNALSLLLWIGLLQRVLSTFLSSGIRQVYPASEKLLSGVQTLAVAEILHSLVGVVRAPVLTTAMQVASRLLLVWGILYLFGEQLLVSGQGKYYNQVAYLGMVVAWSLSECVRYGYFTYLFASGGAATSVPKWLTWTRYNMFQVLYPLGISCECWLVWNSLTLAKLWDWRYEWFLIGVLVIYVPGSYILFSHMVAQRRRIARGKGKAAQ